MGLADGVLGFCFCFCFCWWLRLAGILCACSSCCTALTTWASACAGVMQTRVCALRVLIFSGYSEILPLPHSKKNTVKLFRLFSLFFVFLQTKLPDATAVYESRVRARAEDFSTVARGSDGSSDGSDLQPDSAALLVSARELARFDAAWREEHGKRSDVSGSASDSASGSASGQVGVGALAS